MQTVHEIQDPFDVKTPLGDGVAMFLFTGSISSNPSFLVKIYHTGELRVVDMRDCTAYGNPSAGEKLEPSKELKSWVDVDKYGQASLTTSILPKEEYWVEVVDEGHGPYVCKSSCENWNDMPTGRYVKI